jgi:hypothetical protein
MTTASQVQTIDLTKVSVMSGATSSSLFGVDGTHDGDPTRFAMIAPAQLKGAALDKPLEESWSVGSIAFAFTPGKTATLKIIQPPQSFCLLFSVPRVPDWTGAEGWGAERDFEGAESDPAMNYALFPTTIGVCGLAWSIVV